MSVKEIWADEIITRIQECFYRKTFNLHVKMGDDFDSILSYLKNILNKRSSANMITLERSIFFENYHNTRYDFLNIIKRMLHDNVPSSWITNILFESLNRFYDIEWMGKMDIVKELISLKDSDNFEDDYLMWRLKS